VAAVSVSYLNIVQTSLGTQPASYPIGTGGKEAGVKLTAYFHLVPKLIRGAIPPLPTRLHSVVLNKVRGHLYVYSYMKTDHGVKLVCYPM
jgi:hypothetical protein